MNFWDVSRRLKITLKIRPVGAGGLGGLAPPPPTFCSKGAWPFFTRWRPKHILLYRATAAYFLQMFTVWLCKCLQWCFQIYRSMDWLLFMKGGGSGRRKGGSSDIQNTGCRRVDFSEQNLVGVDFWRNFRCNSTRMHQIQAFEVQNSRDAISKTLCWFDSHFLSICWYLNVLITAVATHRSEFW